MIQCKKRQANGLGNDAESRDVKSDKLKQTTTMVT